MRTQLLLCLTAALIGAAAASVFWNTTIPSSRAQAAEPQRVPDAPRPVSPSTRGPLADRMLEANRPPAAVAPAGAVEAADDLTPEERVNIAVYEGCNRSVVNINTMATSANLFLLDVVQEGAGSGSILDQQGHVLTNYHVVEGAKEIQVTLFDSKSYPAKLVARDPSTDVAILKIDAPANSLFPVQFGDSTRLRVGQRVFAIGNPFGLERTMTTGVISSLNRALPIKGSRNKSFIQIDAAINPGNSGGPLLDSHGRLIGMNTAIASKTGQSTGVGFAMPVSVISRVVPELITKGHVTRPDAGIQKVYETERGLLIAALQPGGPAEQAGLRGPKIVRERKQQGFIQYEKQTVDRSAADIIVAVNGKPTLTADDYQAVVDSYHPGDEVAITVIREGRETPVRVRLGTSEP